MNKTANTYPVFEDNQVLTSSQLNQLSTYLDEHSRLTRVKLIGMGVACGLKPVWDPAKEKLTITGGTGITSEGFLITMADCVTPSYRSYTLPSGLDYKPFTNHKPELTIHELVTDTASSSTPGLSPVTATFLQGKYIILFVEQFDKDLKSCIGKACDELGQDRIFTVRKLIVQESEADVILELLNDATAPFNPGKFLLGELSMPRVLFTPASDHSKEYYKFSANYTNDIKGASGMLSKLLTELGKTYSTFSPLLSPVYNGVNPLSESELSDLKTTWNTYLGGGQGLGRPAYLGIQYFYDFLKDLILAYNEFRDAAFDLVSICCPDTTLFPMHLMLGKAIGHNFAEPSEYRNDFIEAIVRSDQKQLRESVITLHQRLVTMIYSFDFDRISKPVTSGALALPVRITPSSEKSEPLSARSIPYYYKNFEASDTGFTLAQSWSPENKKKNLAARNIYPLSYNNAAAAGLPEYIKKPIAYDIDKYEFFRIEGHLGQNHTAVKQSIEDAKAAYDLPFNVVSLRLSGAAEDALNRTDLHDLQTAYRTVRAALISTGETMLNYFTANTTVTDIQRPAFLEKLLLETTIDSKGSVSVKPRGVTAAQSTSLIISGFERLLENLCASIRRLIRTETEAANEITSAPNLRTLERPVFERDVNVIYLPLDLKQLQFYKAGLSSHTTFLHAYRATVDQAISCKASLNVLIDRIAHGTLDKNMPEAYLLVSQYASEVNSYLNMIIHATFHNQIAFIHSMMNYRVNYTRTNDPALFSNFTKKHPGIEHKAGVKPGGTFVLLRTGLQQLIAVKADRDVLIKEAREIEKVKLDSATLKMKGNLLAEESLQVQQMEARISKFEISKAAILEIERVAPPPVTADQVIADFALPYMCDTEIDLKDIPVPTSEEVSDELPLLMPAYIEYKFGDYAFAKSTQVSTQGCAATPATLRINVLDLAQVNRDLGLEGRIRLVDAAGGFLKEDGRVLITSTPKAVASMSTYNYPNTKTTTTKRGTVTILKSNAAPTYSLTYKPEPYVVGVDSFYYMIEYYLNNQLHSRSSIGKVTIVVTNQCKDPNAPKIPIIDDIEEAERTPERGGLF